LTAIRVAEAQLAVPFRCGPASQPLTLPQLIAAACYSIYTPSHPQFPPRTQIFWEYLSVVGDAG